MNEDTDHGFIKRICYDDGKETGIPSEELVRIEGTKLFPAAGDRISPCRWVSISINLNSPNKFWHRSC